MDELKDLCTKKMKFAIPPESKTYSFYCQEEDPEHNTYFGILKGILHQMVESNEDLVPLCAEKVGSGGDALTSVEMAESLIESFFEYDSRQYVIVDGLDECESVDEMRRTVNFFKENVDKCDNKIAQGRLRVMFVSQLLPELANSDFMPEDEGQIGLKPSDFAEDIRAYVKARLPDFAKPRATKSGFNLSENELDQIESIICHRSESLPAIIHSRIGLDIGS